MTFTKRPSEHSQCGRCLQRARLAELGVDVERHVVEQLPQDRVAEAVVVQVHLQGWAASQSQPLLSVRASFQHQTPAHCRCAGSTLINIPHEPQYFQLAPACKTYQPSHRLLSISNKCIMHPVSNQVHELGARQARSAPSWGRGRLGRSTPSPARQSAHPARDPPPHTPLQRRRSA